ncbi:LysR family transcriptional regulator [Corynebacterium freneyi]|uniref:LysR family transcriptional regulator n=1 Tax=Corynebacterium freneyi TaxID=134034 RepID=UPI0006901BF4|nr:LysR family transcriptional regulator [Corynebacterium freneyi]
MTRSQHRVGRIDLLRHWTIFLAVAEERSFRLAAERLEVSQPGVSQGLRRLEEHLGIVLVRRTPGGAEITAEGRVLLPMARTLVKDAAALGSEARRLAELRLRERVGFAPSVPSPIAQTVIAAIRNRGIGIEAIHGTCGELVEAVGSGTLAAAVIDEPTPIGDLVRGIQHSQQRWILVPDPSMIRDDGQVNWRKLDELELVTPPRSDNPAGHDQLLSLFARYALAPKVIEVCGESQIPAVVATGSAFAIVGPDTAGLAAQEVSSILPSHFERRLRVVVHPHRTEFQAGGDIRSIIDRAMAAVPDIPPRP